MVKSKWTIVLAVLLLAVLAAPEFAEAQGYNVRRNATVRKVNQYANNAEVNWLTFLRTTSTEPDITDAPDGETLTIKIGFGLLITIDDSVREKATAPFSLLCDTDGDGSFNAYCQSATGTVISETSPSATFSNEGGNGIMTITIPEDDASNQSFVVRHVWVDASALDAEDEIIATVTSTTDATSVGLGGGSDAGGVSGVVGVVMPGLKVTATKDADLACSAATPAPSITVTEGFNGAWGAYNLQPAISSERSYASVKIVLDNLPDEAKVEWPATVNSTINVAPSGADEDLRVNGTLTMDAAESSSNGKEVVYDYTRVNFYKVDDPDDTDPSDGTDQIDQGFTREQSVAARSFKVVPSKTTFVGDASIDIAAQLWPEARKGIDGEKLNLESQLSYDHPLLAPEKGNGEGWLVISECVTYLLYPFVTCGATPGWSTGISVSNTSADGNIFGAFDESSQQHGSVVMYGFPKERMLSEVEDEEEEPTVEAVVDTISEELKAGETMTFDCGNTMMAGIEGYAIIRAGFQHGRGMAFVLGNFADGAGVDVSHGYMAEVINDPSTRSDAIE